ncbi:MAG: GGDEF domain-containing protein [Pseudomonadota bacterium]
MNPAPPGTRDHSLYESAWAASGKGSWRLSWAEPLESDFQSSYSERYRNHMAAGLAVGALAMVVSVFEDFMLPPGDRAGPLFVRFGVVMPVVLFLLWLIRKPAMDRHQQGLLLFATLGGAAAFLMMGYFVESPLGRMYLDTLILIQLFGLTLLRMQFAYAVVSVLVIAAGTTLALAWLRFPGHAGEHVIDLMLITFAGMLCLVANYLMERSARSDYLQQRLLEFRQEDLERSNSHLEQLLRSDALTGIANRRCFDQALTDEFRRAERGSYPLALLMLDVDCFKQYNDTYGHQAGDEALMQVAQAIERFARRPGDLAARYGGEEFALILPGSGEEDALGIADELVAHMYARHLPHGTSRVCDRITVSVGVAVIQPAEGKTSIAELIANADQALYLAKARGRNRACTWSMLQAQAEPD